MRAKEKARRRVSYPRSLDSTVNPQDVVSLGKRPLHYVDEPGRHLGPVGKKPCNSQLSTSSGCNDHPHHTLADENSEHCVSHMQLTNGRKRKASEVYGMPVVPLCQRQMVLCESTNSDYNDCYATDSLPATPTKNNCANLTVQSAVTMDTNNVGSYGPTTPMPVDKGKRRLFGCSTDTNYDSQQEQMLPQACFTSVESFSQGPTTSTDSVEDFLCDEWLCEIEGNNVFALNEGYVCPYASSSSAVHDDIGVQSNHAMPLSPSIFLILLSLILIASTLPLGYLMFALFATLMYLSPCQIPTISSHVQASHKFSHKVSYGVRLRPLKIKVTSTLAECNILKTCHLHVPENGRGGRPRQAHSASTSRCRRHIPSNRPTGVRQGPPDTYISMGPCDRQHNGTPQRINKLHPSYLWLHFPLLFIYGEEGYHLCLRLTGTANTDSDGPKKMSMKMYYAYQLYDRQGQKMAEASSIVASPKTTDKEIMTEPEDVSLASLTPSDIGKTIYVKAYRKWTLTNKQGKPTMFCCMFIDHAILPIASAKPSTEDAIVANQIAENESIAASSTAMHDMEQSLPVTPPEHTTTLPSESKAKYGPRKASVRRNLFSEEKESPAPQSQKKPKKNDS
ncbi:hypothetical protein CTI12_AA548580 [Artemisia annua]|uniref:Uncharacterized protein n=1 Tax=Artemisia annua TaxID=35608 RepID=A0A2U1KZ23_ARTAN|nr:hypothetical protein CTI12_AA548580 [Artemisia annua]